MQIVCRLIPVYNPFELPDSVLPVHDLEILADVPQETPHLRFFQDLLEGFNNNGDSLISDVFDLELSDRYFEIAVIATRGIPEPYEAWCAEYAGHNTVFFNLSLWTEDDLASNGLAVLKHEIAHVLLNECLPQVEPLNPTAVLDHILVDEGVAHFVGYTGSRMALISEHRDKWASAERTLEMAMKHLSSGDVNKEEKDRLLLSADTGNYWDKYAAISGMFRAASIYQYQGAAALMHWIKRGRLPSCLNGQAE